MGKKILLGCMLFLGLVGGYGLVFGSNLVFGSGIKFLGSVSSNVYLDDSDLQSTILIYQSQSDISGYSVQSVCDIGSKFVGSKKGLYFFEVDFSKNSNCKNGNVILESGSEKIGTTLHTLSLLNDSSLVSLYVDYSSEDLMKISQGIASELKKYSIYKNYNEKNIIENFNFFNGKRKYLEAQKIQNLIQKILVARSKKYISPVPGYKTSDNISKIPDAARPYRESYTDGIHHGWDINAPFLTDVAALDQGVIVRVVSGFNDSDFSRIVYTTPISYEQKLKNLDILRGNQVWLKTMKGEVIFYSHLDSIPKNIIEGVIVKAGDILGKIGASGVPETGYDDYHLHFEISKNPYIFEKAGTYDFGDYMSWDWQGKGLSQEQILKLPEQVFQY